MDDLNLQVELPLEADQRDHDLGPNLDAFLLHLRGGFEDRARLHFGNLGIPDAEAASAEAQHGVELVQALHTLVEARHGHTHLLGQFLLRFLAVRQEFVERRIEEPDGGRVALQGAEDPRKVFPLIRQQLAQRGLPLFGRLGKDHLAHRVNAVPFKEHVLRPGEPDTDGAKRHGVFGLLRRIGVGAHTHAGGLVTPLHELLEVLELLGALRRLVSIEEAGHDLGRRGLHRIRIHRARGAVDREPFALGERPPIHQRGARLIVHLDGRGATHAHLAHLPGHQCRV